MPSAMKLELISVLKADMVSGQKLDPADRVFLRRRAKDYADERVWNEVVVKARTFGRFPEETMYAMLIDYVLLARRFAENAKYGYDPIFRERQAQRARLLELAQKADDLARYFQEVQKYSGVASFFQRFLALPVTLEQERVRRNEPSNLRAQQLANINLQLAQLLRQRAGRAPQPTAFISRKKAKRDLTAFIHLMADYMVEMCGSQMRHALSILASMAFNCSVVDEDVRKTLIPNTRAARGKFAHSAKK
jgi:hypothetical protein